MVYDIYVGAQRVRVNSVLSYSSSDLLKTGQLVMVPLRNQLVFGAVVQASTSSPSKLKPISEVLPYRLSKNQLQLIDWLGQYYPAPLSAIVHLFMPPAAIKRVAQNQKNEPVKTPALPKLTNEQAETVKKILDSSEVNYLLHGKTGSGKTRVYAELAAQAISSGKSAIILTPEIGLTTPLLDYFQQAFGRHAVICYHSQLSALDKAAAWSAAASGQPRIIIGPRSALFLPVTNIGLIVVDEAHDGAYKQEQQPFYHATRVATKLAALCNAKCILGSATPTIGDYYAFQKKQLPVLSMKKLAIESAYSRKDLVIDLRDRANFQRSQLLSEPLIQAVELALKTKRQALLFLNRRGSARTILCHNCGWQELCPHCDIALTYHADTNDVLCHVCSFKKPVPLQCPECRSTDIVFQTPGTKSVEAEVKRLFPGAKIGRFDKDSASGTKLHQTYAAVKGGSVDILIGTQLLTKGLDLTSLTVIGILQADSGLMLPDFSATERTFQQISQVAGRLGRGHGEGSLYLQTYQPELPLFRWALEQDYESFYKSEVSERLQFGFPPACYLLVLQVKRATQAGAAKAMARIAGLFEGVEGVTVGSSAPAFHEKKSGSYYWQVVVRAKDRRKLTAIIEKLPSQTLYNIDPTDLL